jgi:hypothetical protein
MEKNAQRNNQSDEETLDQEVWLTILYLDPDLKPKPSDVVVVIAMLVAWLIVCAVFILLNMRGL